MGIEEDETMDEPIDELPDPDGSNTLPVPPGPWFGQHAHTRERWIRADGDPRYVHTIYALRTTVRTLGGDAQANVFSAHIQNDNQLATPEELEANAQLIVTAPRMLAALLRCEQEARDEGREWFWIAAVIREATGQ